MNLSKIIEFNTDNVLEPEVDKTPWLRQRETELTRIIESIERIAVTEEWKTLKSLIFEGLEESFERRLKEEANKIELNQPEIHRLQGQLVWVKKYADFKKLADAFRLELSNVRKQLVNN